MDLHLLLLLDINNQYAVMNSTYPKKEQISISQYQVTTSTRCQDNTITTTTPYDDDLRVSRLAVGESYIYTTFCIFDDLYYIYKYIPIIAP